jgi:hypothetical protein
MLHGGKAFENEEYKEEVDTRFEGFRQINPLKLIM